VGALIALQMLSSRVTSPLVQIVGLIHEYQETALSVRMLGEVMNAAPERLAPDRGVRPQFKGRITFEDVTFRYDPASLPALADINLDIAAGTVLGVVGHSGSGKSTVGKLIQGLYRVQEGLVRLDGVDIRQIDIHHLRRSIGVVMQDSFLFTGTVRDNIVVSRPEATPDQVLEAAQLAGADEFIERLPKGLDTHLGEGAVNLSGGQRQRLAIARVLLTKPRILILDEATSALDPESEAIIRRSLARISEGRTVIVISHRLTNLVGADDIILLEQGRLACQGRHEKLLADCPQYARLWNQQIQCQPQDRP
jgi:ATP-binding cassette, subfamily B, bacterial HlyB/CyaB